MWPRRLLISVVLLSTTIIAISSATNILQVTIQDDSVTAMKKWIAQGGKTRLDVLPHYAPDLGLPKDASLCARTDDGKGVFLVKIKNMFVPIERVYNMIT